MSTKEQRLALTKKLWGKHSVEEVAMRVGVSKRTIFRYARELDLPRLQTEQSVDERIKEVRQQEKLRSTRKQNTEMARRVITLERELEVMQDLRATPTFYKIAATGSPRAEATAVMVASDWHIEEVVYPWQVSGLNEFNEAICRERVQRFFRHGLKLVRLMQKSTYIDTLVLALLGDFISGGIHDELMEGNRLLPADALIEAQEHIASGIRYLLEHSDLKIVVPCAMGNHGRFTAKRRISTEAGNSLERLMYHSLAQIFVDEPRVQFVFSNGYHTYVKVYDFNLRFHHGHSVRYYGGVGGISIPLNKAVAQWNKGRHADLDVLGHFHQFLDGGSWIENGSLVGYGAYALSIKASPEPPRQAFFLIDREVGKTVVCPIILDRDR